MFGFRICIGNAVRWPIEADEHSFIREWHEGDVHITQWSLRKFQNDKLWQDTPEYFLATEGVLFNRDTILQALPSLHICDWRGSFACVQYDKQTRECRIYNDLIGSKMLFWCQTEQGIYLSSDLFELAHATGLHTPDSNFMQTILTHGYASDDSTMVSGIHRICAGEYLQIQNGRAHKAVYHRFDNRPLHPLNHETLAEADRLFRQAVQRVLRKNEEYGLHNFFPLSGGLDSRSVQLVARQLTTKPITNFTYSQTGHYDHLLPQQIAAFLGNEWQFLPLDGGDYLKQIDAITRAGQALVNYNGPSEIYYCSQHFDWTQVGVVATGVNGDNIFSVETDSRHEIERLYSLSFAGNGLGSPLILQQYTETYSPFCDADVLEYVLHIPLRERWNYRFYDRWLLRYYPDAARWDHKGQVIGHRHPVLSVGDRHIPLRDLPKRITWYILKHLHLYDGYRMTAGDSMNPYDSWMQTNVALRETLHSYYKNHKNLLAPYPMLAQQAEEIMTVRTAYQQCGVLTILSAIQQIQ